MRKRLNLRFIGYASAALAILGVGVHFLHAYQVGRNSDVLLIQADRAEKNGELLKAVNHLNLYLGIKPGDVDVQARYGLLLADEKLANSPRAKLRALLALDKALLGQPDRHDLRRRVVELSIELRRFTNARNDIEKYLLPNASNDTDRGELEVLIARCDDATGKYPEARRWYELAVKHAPTNAEAAGGLANLLRSHADEVLRPQEKETRAQLVAKADKAIDDYVKAANSASAYLTRASYRRMFAPADKAAVAADVAAARERDPDAADALLAAAELELSAQRYDAARQLLQRGIEQHPQEWALYRLLARTEVVAKQPGAALKAVQAGLEKSPGQAGLLLELVELTVNAGDEEGTKEALEQLGRAGFPSAAQDVFRARLAIAAGRWLDAVRLLEQSAGTLAALATDAGGQGAFGPFALQSALLLGQCYEQTGDNDHALAAYKRAVVQDPQSIPGRFGQARVRAALRQTDLAIDQYRQAIALYQRAVPPQSPPAFVWLEIAKFTLAKQLPLSEQERDWAAVARALRQVQLLQPPLPEADVLAADVEALQGRFKQARDDLARKYGDAATRPVAVWVALAVLDQRLGRDGLAVLAEAETHIDARASAAKSGEESAARDRTELDLAKVRILAGRDRAEAIPALKAVAAAAEPRPAGERRRLLAGVAETLQQLGAEADAVPLWERLAKEQPHDLRYRVNLFDLAARAGRVEDASKWQQEMRAIEGPDGVLWRFFRIALLLNQASKSKDDRAGLAEARKLLTDVTARRPNWSRAVLCEARLDELEGRADDALTKYQRAAQLGDPDARQRAADLLFARGRGAEADRLFREIPATELSPETRRRAATSALLANDPAHAWDLAEKAVPADSTDYRDHLWLGGIALAAGRHDRAEAAFVKARKLAGDAHDAQVVWVQFLAATGKKDLAAAACAEADRRFAGKDPLALARCYEAIGQTDRAVENYRAAAATPGDATALGAAADYLRKIGRTKDAIELLQRLLNECATSAPDAAIGARCTLAVLWAAEGKTAEALALLGNGTSVREQRARASVQALRNDRASRLDAVRILETLIERHEADAADVYLAARLYEYLNDLPKARSRYLHLIDMPGGAAPIYLAASADALLRYGEAGTAGPVVDRLEAKLPGAFVTLALKAKVLRAAGKNDEALDLARKAARHTDAGILGAKLLEEFGDFAAAEQAYRQAARPGQPPANALVLANFLIDRKRYGEALDVCDRAWENCPVDAVADLCLRIVNEGLEPANIERVARRMEEVLRVKDRADLLTQLASVRSFQGRFADTVTLYRRAIQLEPRQATALNNLAWILALQGGHGAEAVALAERAVAVAGDPGFKDTLALARLSLDRPEATQLAVRELESLVAYAPEPTTYFHLARAFLQAGRKSEALRAWQLAKSRGLRKEKLHPLEQGTYDRLARDLQVE